MKRIGRLREGFNKAGRGREERSGELEGGVWVW